MPRLLFVCTGNTCRSPMAEYRARVVALAHDRVIDVASAGISAVDGAPASMHAQFVVREEGGDLGDHRSRKVDAAVLRDAGLVITMTAAHRNALQEAWPEFADRVLTLAEAAGQTVDVGDPWGGSLEGYETTYGQISELMASAWPLISQRLGI